MTLFMHDVPRSGGRCSRWAGVVLLSLPVVGCALIGVEPDEIDLAAGSETDDGGEAASSEGNDTSQGTEDGDPGDGDPGDGDPGDGDPGGDGDGDADAGDGDGESDSTGDGDGDGDGDPLDETSCQELGATPVQLGPNDVTIAAAPSVLEGSCGFDGPEAIYSFVSEEAGIVGFALTADFDAALYAVDGLVCVPLVELLCVNTPDILSVDVEAQQTVYVVVDSADPNGGSGTLDVAFAP